MTFLSLEMYLIYDKLPTNRKNVTMCSPMFDASNRIAPKFSAFSKKHPCLKSLLLTASLDFVPTNSLNISRREELGAKHNLHLLEKVWWA